MIPFAQNPYPNLKNIFFILNYATPPVITGFEQLSRSICCRVMAGQSLPWQGKLCLFLKSFELGRKLDFWRIILATDMLATIKGSIDADFDLVFNKALSQKNGSMGWGPGPAKGDQRVLYSSLALAAGDLWPK